MNKVVKVLGIVFFVICIIMFTASVAWFIYTMRAFSIEQNMGLTVGVGYIFYIFSALGGVISTITSLILNILTKRLNPDSKNIYSIISSIILIIIIVLSIILYIEVN